MTDENDIVQDALAPGVFSFAEVVQGRGYPKDTVTLYTDEPTAYEISKVDERLAEIEKTLKGIYPDDDQRQKDLAEQVALRAKRSELLHTLETSGMVFHIQGISDELRDDILKSAQEKIKPEYDSHRNFQTGQVEKVKKDSPERDRLYTNMLWAAQITKIVAADGRTDTAPGLPAAEAIRNLPMAQQVKFFQAIQRLTVAAEAFEATAESPDFS